MVRLIQIPLHCAREARLNLKDYYYYYYFNWKWVLSGGSVATIRHNTQITYITQNNTTIKRNTAHKPTHTIKDTLHRMNTITTTIIILISIKINMLYAK
jgi:hypothetical protein